MIRTEAEEDLRMLHTGFEDGGRDHEPRNARTAGSHQKLEKAEKRVLP